MPSARNRRPGRPGRRPSSEAYNAETRRKTGRMSSLFQNLSPSAIRWRLLPAMRVAFSVFGRPWNEFYAWMLNYQDRKLTLDQILRRKPVEGRFQGLWDWWRGDYYLDYMKRHGVLPDQTIVDYGCGYGRLAIPCLRYQASGGHYVGTEITERRLDLAKEWIAREGLSDKSFELVLSMDNTMPYLSDATVDVVWVMSVFNHMPDQELDTSLAAIWRVLKPGGVLFCYYAVDDDTGWKSVKDFRRSDADMEQRIAGLGFTMELMTDWDDDLEERPEVSRMMLVTKPAP